MSFFFGLLFCFVLKSGNNRIDSEKILMNRHSSFTFTYSQSLSPLGSAVYTLLTMSLFISSHLLFIFPLQLLPNLGITRSSCCPYFIEFNMILLFSSFPNPFCLFLGNIFFISFYSA